MTSKITVQYDVEARAAYIQVSDNAVTRTVEVDSSLLVDLDDMGVVVGIEVLSLDAKLPIDELVTQFHVHTNVVAALNRIRPTVGHFLGISRGSDGVGRQTGLLVSA